MLLRFAETPGAPGLRRTGPAETGPEGEGKGKDQAPILMIFMASGFFTPPPTRFVQ